ncbi:MAG: tetraprenyl-beta-curcumene synthase family protein [Acidobacteriota bacterium]
MKAFQKLRLLYRHQRIVLPLVDRALVGWHERARAIPEPGLRRQAVVTLDRKRVHCDAGGAYAAMALDRRETLVPLIVAFQTISDYLDDLCDVGSTSGAADFRALHRAMHDAVSPGTPLADYYTAQPRDDGGYLVALVEACRRHVTELPGFAAAQPAIVELVGHYTELQVHKHIEADQRVTALEGWLEELLPDYPEMTWWELAAASASTIGVYALFEAATDPTLKTDTAEGLKNAYFPAITGLHILLDYLIDQADDEAAGELNFISCYTNTTRAIERLGAFVDLARRHAHDLPHAYAHELRVAGLLGVYLSDAAIDTPALKAIARRLLARGGWWARLVHLYWRARS